MAFWMLLEVFEPENASFKAVSAEKKLRGICRVKSTCVSLPSHSGSRG